MADPAEVADPAKTADQSRRAKRDRKRTSKLARQIESFAKSHGGSVEGQIAYIGERGARVVLVAENGDWGDLVAPSQEVAEQAVERSGITVHEKFDGALADRVRTGPYEWTRMAGSQFGGPSND
ncbi:hypothetical protein [Streptomyces sp. NPDC005438]|uniref:hypothetical protein n=1 Tax=Streptomyces sp. NPDC005438 TaxID=3156880 RepID=UPI0033BA1560